MTKLTLSDVTNLQNEGSAVLTMHNNNVATVAAVENTISRDGSSPNQMAADLDMNSHKVINTANATAAGDAVSLGYLGNNAVLYSSAQTLTVNQKAQARDNIGASATAGAGGGGTGVSTFNGRNGIVVSVSGDYTGTQITNTPAGQIAATNVQAAINELDTEKVASNSPALTGVPTAPTAAADTNSTQIATTAYADTIKALKANIASPTFTGVPAAPTAAPGTNTTQLATTAFTTAAIAATSAPTSYDNGFVNGTLAVSASASALTIAIQTLAGANPSAGDPVTVMFRNVTGTTGNYVPIALTGATSFTISSGSTLGVTSATAFRVWIVAFNDGGTFRLGVINCSQVNTSVSTGFHFIYPLMDGIESATSEGGAGAADNAAVIYSSATVTSKAMRILGYAEWGASGLVTAGAWTTTNLSAVQLMSATVKLPGAIVQDRGMVTATQTSTSGATFIITAATLAITPRAACNPLKITSSGTLYAQATGIGVTGSGFASLFRTSNANPIGIMMQAFNTAGDVISACHMRGMDLPNTTSSTTYSVYISHTTGIATYYPIAGSGRNADLNIQELMG